MPDIIIPAQPEVTGLTVGSFTDKATANKQQAQGQREIEIQNRAAKFVTAPWLTRWAHKIRLENAVRRNAVANDIINHLGGGNNGR